MRRAARRLFCNDSADTTIKPRPRWADLAIEAQPPPLAPDHFDDDSVNPADWGMPCMVDTLNAANSVEGR